MSNDKTKFRQNNICKLIDSFEPGDFLFGLEECVREIYYYDLREKLMKVGATYHFVTVDDLIKPLEADYIYDDHVTLSPLDEQPSPVNNYGRLLLSTAAFTEISSQVSSPTKKEKNKLVLACLLALEHHTKKIHFCLDRLDLNKVRSRRPENRKYYEGFTSHELRYIASHYQDLGPKVLFYLGGEQVPPPWEVQGLSPDEWLSADIELVSIDDLPNPLPRLAPLRLNFNATGDGAVDNETENQAHKRFKFFRGDELWELNRRNNLH